jgi:hypothetical protein
MYEALVAALSRLGIAQQAKILEWARKSIGDKAELAAKFPAIKASTNLNILFADDEVLDKIAELFASRGIGVSKVTLVPISGALVNPRQVHKQVLATLKKYLETNEINAIRASFALIRLEKDSTPTPESIKNVREERDRFHSRDEDFRRRVYSDCLSGWIEDALYEKALDLEFEKKPTDEIKNTISRAFYDSIYSNPMNIYVNDTLPNEEIISRLHEKLTLQRRSIVRVYARSANWKRVCKVGMEFANAKGFRSHSEQRSIGMIGGGCFRIWRSELGPSFPEIERLMIDSLREKMR